MAGDAYWKGRSAKIKAPFTSMTKTVLIGAGPMLP